MTLPVSRSTGPVAGNVAMPVYAEEEATATGVEGGAATPYYAVTDADLASGKFVVAGGSPTRVAVARGTRPVMGGPAIPMRRVAGPMTATVFEVERRDLIASIAPANQVLYVPALDTAGSSAINVGGPAPVSDRNLTWIGTTPGAAPGPFGGTAHQFDGVNDCLNAWTASLAALWNWAAWTVILAYRPTSAGVWTNGLARNLMYFRNAPFSSIVQQTKHSTNGQIGFQMRIGGTDYNYYYTTAQPTNYIMVGTSYRQASTRMRHFYSAQAFGSTPAVAPTMIHENMAVIGTPSGVLAADGATYGAYSAAAPSGVIDGYECEITIWNDELDFATQITPAMRF